MMSGQVEGFTINVSKFSCHHMIEITHAIAQSEGTITEFGCVSKLDRDEWLENVQVNNHHEHGAITYTLIT